MTNSNSMGSSITSVNQAGQTLVTTARTRRLVNGKLSDSSEAGGIAIDETTPIYRSSIDNTLSTDPKHGVETNIKTEIAIRKDTEDLLAQHQRLQNKGTSPILSDAVGYLFNRTPQLLPTTGNAEAMIALAVAAKYIGNLGAWVKTGNQPINTNPASTANAASNSTSASVSSNTNSLTSRSSAPATTSTDSAITTPQANNQKTIEALMAQAYGNTNIQDNLNTLAKGTYTSKINKKIGGKLLEVTFTYPNVMTMIKMRKLLKRVVQLGEQAVVDPEGAYDRLMSLKSLSEGGKAKASAQRYIKSRLRKRGFISKPVSRTQYMELRKTFFENTLKLLDITMGGNREVVVAILGIADTIFTKYNDGMQRAFKDANNFAPSPTPPTSPRSGTA